MPYISDWKMPVVAFLIDGYPIYHAYRNNECGAQEQVTLEYWYQVLPDGADCFDDDQWLEFDIRDLKEFKKVEASREKELEKSLPVLIPYEPNYRSLHKHILKKALFSGSLLFHLKLLNKDIEINPYLEQKSFKVDVTRTSSRTRTFQVKARSIAEAERKALEVAGDYDFNETTESDPEYEAEGGVWEVVYE